MFKFTVRTLGLMALVAFFLTLPLPAQKTSKLKKTPKPEPDAARPAQFEPTEMQQSILDEINAARSNPANYIKFLEDLKKGLKDKILVMPDGERLLTKNGVDAIDNAIVELKTFPKLKLLTISAGLSKVAEMQLNDLQENINLGHRGRDGSDLSMRMYKIGVPGAEMAENISYYSDKSRTVLLNMILDEQSLTKAHRKNIFSTRFNEVGIAFGKSKDNIALCVLVFNDKFTEKTEKGGALRVMD